MNIWMLRILNLNSMVNNMENNSKKNSMKSKMAFLFCFQLFFTLCLIERVMYKSYMYNFFLLFCFWPFYRLFLLERAMNKREMNKMLFLFCVQLFCLLIQIEWVMNNTVMNKMICLFCFCFFIPLFQIEKGKNKRKMNKMVFLFYYWLFFLLCSIWMVNNKMVINWRDRIQIHLFYFWRPLNESFFFVYQIWMEIIKILLLFCYSPFYHLFQDQKMMNKIQKKVVQVLFQQPSFSTIQEKAQGLIRNITNQRELNGEQRFQGQQRILFHSKRFQIRLQVELKYLYS